MNEPVAWMDKESGVVCKEVYATEMPNNLIPLYTHPVKELNDGGEPVKNATYWKRQYNLMATQNDNLKSGLYHANEQIKYLESHPVKEQLTEEQVIDITKAFFNIHPETQLSEKFSIPLYELTHFARAILRKAQEK